MDAKLAAMMPVLSRSQMRELDAHAIDKCSVPGLLLMENAGRGATEVLLRELLGGKVSGGRAVVVCGTGNNGGDGLVIARHLAVHGVSALVFLAGHGDHLSPDARTNLAAWRGVGAPFASFSPAIRSRRSRTKWRGPASSSTRFSALGSIARSTAGSAT